MSLLSGHGATGIVPPFAWVECDDDGDGGGRLHDIGRLCARAERLGWFSDSGVARLAGFGPKRQRAENRTALLAREIKKQTSFP